MASASFWSQREHEEVAPRALSGGAVGFIKSVHFSLIIIRDTAVPKSGSSEVAVGGVATTDAPTHDCAGYVKSRGYEAERVKAETTRHTSPSVSSELKATCAWLWCSEAARVFVGWTSGPEQRPPHEARRGSPAMAAQGGARVIRAHATVGERGPTLDTRGAICAMRRGGASGAFGR